MNEPLTLHTSRLARLPKRKQAEVAQHWERYRELKRMTQEKGMLVPLKLAAKLLCLSINGLNRYVKGGVLEFLNLDGQLFVAAGPLEHCVRLPRPIPSVISCQPWAAREDRLLRTQTDDELAALLGRPLSQVKRRRRELKIPTPVHRSPCLPWTAEEESFLGTGIDEVIARKLGRTTSAVTQRRSKLNIPAYGTIRSQTPEPTDTPMGAAIQIIASDLSWAAKFPKEKKEELARTWQHFREAKQQAELKGMLVPRRFATRLLGVSKQRVHQLVAEGGLETVEVDGVPYVVGSSLERYARTEYLSGSISNKWTAEEERLLGTAPDAVIGQRLGRSKDAVQMRRAALRIPSHRQNKSRFAGA